MREIFLWKNRGKVEWSKQIVIWWSSLQTYQISAERLTILCIVINVNDERNLDTVYSYKSRFYLTMYALKHQSCIYLITFWDIFSSSFDYWLLSSIKDRPNLVLHKQFIPHRKPLAFFFQKHIPLSIRLKFFFPILHESLLILPHTVTFYKYILFSSYKSYYLTVNHMQWIVHSLCGIWY